MHLLSYSKTKNKHKYILPISGFSNFLFQYKRVNSVKDQGEEWKKRREEERETELTNNSVPYLCLLSKRYLHLLLPNS